MKNRGAALIEYAIIAGALAVTVIASINAYGKGVDNAFANSTWDVKKEIIVNTGYTSPYKEEKVLGIAENYNGKVVFKSESAGYHSAVGMYKFDNQGVIKDVRVLFADASEAGAGGTLIPGKSSVSVPLHTRDQIGFFIASNAARKNSARYLSSGKYELLDENGDPATLFSTGLLTLWRDDPKTGHLHAIRTQYAHNLFYSHGDPNQDYAPNIDHYPHTIGWVDQDTGRVTLGFEDLKTGGDRDYNDVVLEFDIGRSNAAVLDPNISYEYSGYDTWAQKLHLWDSQFRTPAPAGTIQRIRARL